MPEPLNVWLQHYTQAADRGKFFYFPVNPESITFNMSRDTIDVALWRHGTVSRPGPKKPLEVTFAGFFPDPGQFAGPNGPSWLGQPLAVIRDPWDTRDMLRIWQESDRKQGAYPLKFGIGEPANFAMWCIMTQFEAETAPPNDLRYTISLRQQMYLPVIKRIKRGPRGQRKPNRRLNPKGDPKKIKTKKGETLFQVAKRVYGTTGRGEVAFLLDANRGIMPGKKKIYPSTTKLPKGLVLKVPDLLGINEKGVY